MFRFMIRDLLWLMVVVGLAVMWWIDRAAMHVERASLDAERAAVKAKKKELDAKFIQLVDATDRLNNATFGRPVEKTRER